MKTKIVYVVVSEGNDGYLEQLSISLYSLRLHNPNVVVEVLTDKRSAKTFTGKRKQMLRDVSINAVETPSQFTKMQRSRFLKTNVRRFVVGDYLMIDLDTLILDDLSELDNLECNIGAVLDYYGNPYYGERELWDKKNLELMGWQDLAVGLRYNSGVFYVKDVPECYTFYEEWYNNWLMCKSKGINIDQLSLRRTVSKYPIVNEINSNWHVMPNQRYGVFDLDLIMNAKIIHYFDLSYIPLLKSPFVVDYIKRNGDLPKESKDAIKNNLRTIIACTTYRNIENVGDGYDLIPAGEAVAIIRKSKRIPYMVLNFLAQIMLLPYKIYRLLT